MKLIAALTALFEAVSAYLKVKAIQAPNELRLSLLREIETLADERDRLRLTGRSSDALRADELHQRIVLREGIVAAALPAADSRAGGGAAGADR